jgi:uncharacterized membrane protein YkgB
MVVVVVVVGVGCLFVFMTSWLGLLGLGVLGFVMWLMSFLSCFARALGMVVVMD